MSFRRKEYYYRSASILSHLIISVVYLTTYVRVNTFAYFTFPVHADFLEEKYAGMPAVI